MTEVSFVDELFNVVVKGRRDIWLWTLRANVQTSLRLHTLNYDDCIFFLLVNLKGAFCKKGWFLSLIPNWRIGIVGRASRHSNGSVFDELGMSLKNQLFSQIEPLSQIQFKKKNPKSQSWCLSGLYSMNSEQHPLSIGKNMPYIATFYRGRKMEETSGSATEEAPSAMTADVACNRTEQHKRILKSSSGWSKIRQEIPPIAFLKHKTLHCHHNTMLYVRAQLFLKGALRRFREEIQTQNFNIHNINEVK